jgi:hypothetical protein
MAVLGNCVKFADLGQLVDPVDLPADGAGGFLPGISPKTQSGRADPRAAPREDGWEHGLGVLPDGTQHRGGAIRQVGTPE